MVFPLYDDNPFRHAIKPWVTWGLIALNVAIFIVEVTSTDAAAQAMITSWGVVPATITHYSPGAGGWTPPATLVTSLFLHGGWEHLLGNMIYLWVFGDDIEDALGRVRFLAFYLLCGIAASLAFVAFNPSSGQPLVGASGAISGILAAYLLLRPCARVSVFMFRFVVRVQAYWVIGAWVVLQFLSIASQANDGVAYMAHMGGLLAGALLFPLIRPMGVPLFQCIDTDAETTPKAAQ
ncbi:MAG TPA: rhomboid family intramembrane serine protease [Hyphomicrobiaceae bacterium]|jgi:membrane associated rhomboid family serine protease|nr:rhomboid family intramembrane serine protease [Hyphomicrobiaceae bacterium]